jgi:hypothetical protein
MLTGLKPFAAYRWVGFGSSSTPEDPHQTGCITPLLNADGTEFRALGVWSTDFVLVVSVPGTTIEGAVRELALYATQAAGMGAAWYRHVLPTTLQLDSTNTLVIALTLTP